MIEPEFHWDVSRSDESSSEQTPLILYEETTDTVATLGRGRVVVDDETGDVLDYTYSSSASKSGLGKLPDESDGSYIHGGNKSAYVKEGDHSLNFSAGSDSEYLNDPSVPDGKMYECIIDFDDGVIEVTVVSTEDGSPVEGEVQFETGETFTDNDGSNVVAGTNVGHMFGIVGDYIYSINQDAGEVDIEMHVWDRSSGEIVYNEIIFSGNSSDFLRTPESAKNDEFIWLTFTVTGNDFVTGGMDGDEAYMRVFKMTPTEGVVDSFDKDISRRSDFGKKFNVIMDESRDVVFYANGESQRIYSFNMDDLSLNWENEGNSTVDIDDSGNLYTGQGFIDEGDEIMFIRDVETGETIEEIDIGRSATSVLAHNGAIYYATYDSTRFIKISNPMGDMTSILAPYDEDSLMNFKPGMVTELPPQEPPESMVISSGDPIEESLYSGEGDFVQSRGKRVFTEDENTVVRFSGSGVRTR